jgi:hypothetical protein
LVAYNGSEFLGGHFDFAAAKALDVGEAGVRAYEDVVGFAETDGLVHY